MTQRFVVGGGRSAIVRGLPSGPMTYFTLGRWGSVMAYSHSTDWHCGKKYRRRLKIWLSAPRGIGPYRGPSANLLVTVGKSMAPGWRRRKRGMGPSRALTREIRHSSGGRKEVPGAA